MFINNGGPEWEFIDRNRLIEPLPPPPVLRFRIVKHFMVNLTTSLINHIVESFEQSPLGLHNIKHYAETMNNPNPDMGFDFFLVDCKWVKPNNDSLVINIETLFQAREDWVIRMTYDNYKNVGLNVIKVFIIPGQGEPTKQQQIINCRLSPMGYKNFKESLKSHTLMNDVTYKLTHIKLQFGNPPTLIDLKERIFKDMWAIQSRHAYAIVAYYKSIPTQGEV